MKSCQQDDFSAVFEAISMLSGFSDSPRWRWDSSTYKGTVRHQDTTHSPRRWGWHCLYGEHYKQLSCFSVMSYSHLKLISCKTKWSYYLWKTTLFHFLCRYNLVPLNIFAEQNNASWENVLFVYSWDSGKTWKTWKFFILAALLHNYCTGLKYFLSTYDLGMIWKYTKTILLK